MVKEVENKLSRDEAISQNEKEVESESESVNRDEAISIKQIEKNINEVTGGPVVAETHKRVVTKEEGKSKHKEVKEVENELSRDEAISQIEKEVESESESVNRDEAISTKLMQNKINEITGEPVVVVAHK